MVWMRRVKGANGFLEAIIRMKGACGKMSRIRIGVIGLGGISTGVHLPGIQKCKGGEISAVCDIDTAVLAAVGEKYGVPENRRFTDYRRLIACPEVQAVEICTPNYMHMEPAMEAIRAKKPFSVEKPMALNCADALKIEQAAARAGVPGMICFSMRFRPAVRFARWMIAQGHLGEILNVFAQYFKSSGLREGRRLEWRFVKKLAGTGVIGDLGSHMLDMTRFLLGDFTGVFARTGIAVKQRKREDSEEIATVDTDDYCNVIASLACGAEATFSISRCAVGCESAVKYEIYGTKGSLAIDLNNLDVLEVCTGDIDRLTHGLHTVKVPDRFYADQTESFLDIVRGGGDGLAPSLNDGVKCQQILDTLMETTASGTWLPIK